MPPTPPTSAPNPGLYSPAVMNWLYDPLVIGLSHRWLWGLRNRHLFAHLSSAAHTRTLSIGPGSGYFERRLVRQGAITELHLLDLNGPSLDAAMRRLLGSGVPLQTWEADALDSEGWPELPRAQFDAVVCSMMAHALPGTGFYDKTALFDNAAAVLRPGGRFAGATILGTGGRPTRAGRRMMALYQGQKNTFHNQGDCADDLDAVLQDRFDEVRVHLDGAVALWSGVARG